MYWLICLLSLSAKPNFPSQNEQNTSDSLPSTVFTNGNFFCRVKLNFVALFGIFKNLSHQPRMIWNSQNLKFYAIVSPPFIENGFDFQKSIEIMDQGQKFWTNLIKSQTTSLTLHCFLNLVWKSLEILDLLVSGFKCPLAFTFFKNHLTAS